MQFNAQSVLKLIAGPIAAATGVAALVLGAATLASPANAAEPKQGNVGGEALKAEFTAPKNEGALKKYPTCALAQKAFAASLSSKGIKAGEATVQTTTGKTCQLKVG